MNQHRILINSGILSDNFLLINIDILCEIILVFLNVLFSVKHYKLYILSIFLHQPFSSCLHPRPRYFVDRRSYSRVNQIKGNVFNLGVFPSALNGPGSCFFDVVGWRGHSDRTRFSKRWRESWLVPALIRISYSKRPSFSVDDALRDCRRFTRCWQWQAEYNIYKWNSTNDINESVFFFPRFNPETVKTQYVNKIRIREFLAVSLFCSTLDSSLSNIHLFAMFEYMVLKSRMIFPLHVYTFACLFWHRPPTVSHKLRTVAQHRSIRRFMTRGTGARLTARCNAFCNDRVVIELITRLEGFSIEHPHEV